jgi:hypothetical protein
VAINLGNLRSYADISDRVVTSVIGTPYPTTATGAWGTGWYDLGALSDKGVDEAVNQNEQKVFIHQGAQLGRILRSQFEHPFSIEAAEENAVSLGLARPNVSVTTTGATAEIQTITLGGTTATGGTFPVIVPGFGTYNAAYNITAPNLATALSALIGQTVGVALAAGVYTITFPAVMGNVGQIQTNSASLLPVGATATAATTTPGVTGTNRSVVTPYAGTNLRQFGIDLIDGAINVRLILTNAEAVLSGTISRNANGIAVLPFTINPYYDPTIGGFFIDLNNDPYRAQGLYV